MVTAMTAFMREIGWNRMTPCPWPLSPASKIRSSSWIIVSGDVDFSGYTPTD